MGALKWMVALSFVLSFSAGVLAQGEDIEHQYGIELRGGYGLYLNNSDPNSFAENFSSYLGTSGYSVKEYSESVGAFAGGISLLYKSKDYFGWHIGLNVFGSDSATATAVNAANQERAGRVFMNATEIFVTGNYYLNITPRFNIHFGGGPAFYFANLDLELTDISGAISSDSFYGAHGRSFGFTGGAGAELFLTKALALKVGGGFRWAPVNRFKYFIEVTDPENPNYDFRKGEIAYWPGTWNTFEVDFSGVFAEVALRIYFDPVAQWKQYD